MNGVREKKCETVSTLLISTAQGLDMSENHYMMNSGITRRGLSLSMSVNHYTERPNSNMLLQCEALFD